MTSYVFSIINKNIKWAKVYEILSSKYEDDFEIIFAVKEKNTELSALEKLQKKHNNIKIVMCEEAMSENDMINKAIEKVEGVDMVLCRDYFEYATVLSDYIVAMGYYGAQIVLYRKKEKQSKFKDFFKNIYNKLINWLFGFKLYEGDVGLMYFGNIALSVLREMPNSAHYTKVNRFYGFDISYVETDHLPKPVFQQKERKNVLISLAIATSCTILEILALVLLSVFNKLGFLGGLLLVLLIVCSVLYMSYKLLKLSVLNQYGDLS